MKFFLTQKWMYRVVKLYFVYIMMKIFLVTTHPNIAASWEESTNSKLQSEDDLATWRDLQFLRYLYILCIWWLLSCFLAVLCSFSLICTNLFGKGGGGRINYEYFYLIITIITFIIIITHCNCYCMINKENYSNILARILEQVMEGGYMGH